MMMNRFKDDFRLGLVVLFGVITVLGITPFAIYRLVAGQYLIAVVDLVIVVCIALGSIHAVRTGRSHQSPQAFVLLDGEPIYHATHYGIDPIAIEKAVSSHAVAETNG